MIPHYYYIIIYHLVILQYYTEKMNFVINGIIRRPLFVEYLLQFHRPHQDLVSASYCLITIIVIMASLSE